MSTVSLICLQTDNESEYDLNHQLSAAISPNLFTSCPLHMWIIISAAMNTTCFVTWRQESLRTTQHYAENTELGGGRGCGGVVMKAVCLRRRFRIILIVNCDMISRTHKRHCCHQCHPLHNAGTCRTMYIAKIYCD